MLQIGQVQTTWSREMELHYEYGDKRGGIMVCLAFFMQRLLLSVTFIKFLRNFSRMNVYYIVPKIAEVKLIKICKIYTCACVYIYIHVYMYVGVQYNVSVHMYFLTLLPQWR
jgi:hypothetical protein